MHRHYGLGHLSPRISSSVRKLAACRRSLSIRAGDAAERLFERTYDRFAERVRLAADLVSEMVVITHVNDNCTDNTTASAQNKGSST